MHIQKTKFPEVIILTPTIHMDNRGTVSEVFRSDVFQDAIGYLPTFVQDNEAVSKKNVIRGLHFQYPNPQGKLVRVTHGAVFDVVVDVRRSSSTFGEWIGVILTSDNKQQLWVPGGFAHGFLSLSDISVFQYKLTDLYNPTGQYGLHWNDPALSITWPLSGEPIVSDKDTNNTIALDKIDFI